MFSGRRMHLSWMRVTPALLAAAEGTPAHKTLKDIVAATRREKLPLHQLVPRLTPLSKDVIFKSGTGVEGFLRLHDDTVAIVTEDGLKYVTPAPGAVERLFPSPPPQAPAGASAAPRSDATPSTPAASGSETGANAKEGMLLSDKHPAYRLVARVKDVAHEDAWYNTNEVYNKVYSTDAAKEAVKHKDFVAFLRTMPEVFWVAKGAFRFRKAGEAFAPEVMEVLSPGRKPSAAGSTSNPGSTAGVAAPSSGVSAPPTGAMAATAANNYGGWGSPQNIPTADDVYEILKYVPIKWTNLGNLGIPQDVKKRHVRIASFLQWLRRQPRYFEVRNLAGTIEVRRAITLHPEAHRMTKEEAEKLVAKRIAEGIHNSIQSTTPEASVGSTASAASSAVHKFLARVCPGYFVPMEIILNRRATKKAMSQEDLFRTAAESPDVFEEVVLRDGTTKLLRRRIGYDSSKWAAAFLDDVNSAEDVALLLNIMAKAPPLWDRMQYLYVRLTDEDKIAVGGYDGLLALLRRHQTVFRVGESFYKRVDSSDPASADEPEPTSNDVHATKLCEENPYATPKELATVFHYLTPEDGATTAAYFVEASSPAMRGVLPPRLITLLQTFPELFTCKEVSPGMYSVERRKRLNPGEVEDVAGMKVEETIEGVAALIPVRGVDVAQLQVWMSLQLKNAISMHFGTLLDLLRKHPDRFHVVENPPYTMVFKQRLACSPASK